MKKKVRVGFLIMTAVTISAISFMVGTNMSANEKKVYIPDEYLREDILEQAK